MSEGIVAKRSSQQKLGQIILKNATVVTLGMFALKALNFLFSVYIVRRLGDDRFGQYSIVLAFVGLFQIFAELGMSQYVMREIAKDRSKAPALFWNLLVLRGLLAILGMVGITLGAAAAGYASVLVLGVFINTCGFLLAAFQAPLQTVLTAYERLDYVTGLAILGQVVFVLFGALFLLSGLGFVWLIIAGLISILPQIGLAAWAIKRHHLATLTFQINPRLWPNLIRAGLPFGVISLALTISFSIDTVMLSKFQPENVVGWYNVAYNLERSLLFFFGGFSTAIVPSLSRTYVNDATTVERWYYRSVKFILLSSLPVAVGGMLIAFPLIRFLYTAEFMPAAQSLQIIIWDVPVLMFASFCGNMTTVVGEEHAAARIYIVSALVNIVLNLYAIPRFSLLGASVVTVITDLIAALQFYFLLRRKLHLPDMTSVIMRVSVASALMGIVVALVSERPLLVPIGVGCVIYGGLVLALRVLDDTERAAIFRFLRRSGDSEAAQETMS